MNKRPIDRKRDSAGMMEIDDPIDQTGITGTVVVDGRLHALKEDSLYEVKLADDVDPKRTNIDIPNSYQRILDLGSKSPLVQRTLLTGEALFKKTCLPIGFDVDAALSLALSALKDIAAMHEIASELDADQKEAVRTARKPKHGLPVPAVGSVGARFKSFIQKADHALQSLHLIMRLFYGKERAKNFETLTDQLCHEYGPDDPFCKLMTMALPFWKRVRAARNNAEHKIPNQKADVKDFHLTEAGKIQAPTIEVIHPKDATPQTSLLDFMTDIIENVTLVFELMVANACHKRAISVGGAPVGIMELSEKQRGQHRPRFSYAAYVGGRWVPFA